MADQQGDGDAIHIAVADRLGEQIGHKSEACQTGQNAEQPGKQRQHGGQRSRTDRVPLGQGQHGCRNQGGQCRIRPQDKNAAWPEYGVGDQGDDRRIQAEDGRDAGRLGVAHADRGQERRQYRSGRKILAEQCPVVA